MPTASSVARSTRSEPSDYSIEVKLLVLNAFSLISAFNIAWYLAAIVPKLFPGFEVTP
jgi:hypothetical protein